jgi:hypothetical protein
VCTACGANQLVEFDLHGGGVSVLRVLDEKHHDESDDGGRCVDDELPCVAVLKNRARDEPNGDDRYGKGECGGATCDAGGFFGETGVTADGHCCTPE